MESCSELKRRLRKKLKEKKKEEKASGFTGPDID
jgi:hypothetical protein